MTLPLHYLRWHYSRAYHDITRVWLNYLWFITHFFSVTILLRSFFSPFKRIEERNKEGFNLQEMAENLSINIIMRLVGIVLRTVILALGSVILLGVVIFGIGFFVLWTTFPLVLIGILYFGLSGIFI